MPRSVRAQERGRGERERGVDIRLASETTRGTCGIMKESSVRFYPTIDKLIDNSRGSYIKYPYRVLVLD